LSAESVDILSLSVKALIDVEISTGASDDLVLALNGMSLGVETGVLDVMSLGDVMSAISFSEEMGVLVVVVCVCC